MSIIGDTGFYEFISGSKYAAMVRYNLVKSAIAVTNEADTTTNHQNRKRFAKRALTGGAPHYDIGLAIASNPSIEAKIKAGDDTFEGDMAFAMNSVFNSFVEEEATVE